MPFTLSPCKSSDFPRLFTIMSLAFPNEPYLTPLFPHNHTPAGRTIGTQRLLAMARTDPHAHFVKVTDVATNEIVGLAKWLIYPNPQAVPIEDVAGAELTGDYWDSEAEKEYARYLFARYCIPRRKSIKEAPGPLISLDLLCVDPGWQSQGAGSMLVRLGMELAEKMGAEMIVEAAVLAKVFYQRCGYKFIEDITIPVPEKWAVKPKVRYLFMQRPAPEQA